MVVSLLCTQDIHGHWNILDSMATHGPIPCSFWASSHCSNIWMQNTSIALRLLQKGHHHFGQLGLFWDKLVPFLHGLESVYSTDVASPLEKSGAHAGFSLGFFRVVQHHLDCLVHHLDNSGMQWCTTWVLVIQWNLYNWDIIGGI